MKIISFSIWGANRLYVDGMIANAKLAPDIYPEWTVRVYHDVNIPQDVVQELQRLGCQTFLISHSRGEWDGLFWRFYPVADRNVEAVIVRDADSRVNHREKAAVDDWLASEYDFHTMRDHVEHNMPIPGGMWGCRNGLCSNMVEDIERWHDFNEKGTDQVFLSTKVWPIVKSKSLAHDRYVDGIFVLPDGEIRPVSSATYYNKYDGCGGEYTQFPRGRIAFADGKEFQRLSCYAYEPLELFGPHKIKPFPPHPPMSHGTFVGEIIR